MKKHEEINEAISDVVTKYLVEEFPDVEITKIDFSTRYTNEWFYHREKYVSRDHKFRIQFKKKDKDEDLSDKMKILMMNNTLVPVPEGKKFKLIGIKEKDRRKALIHLEQLMLVENDR